MPVRVPQRVGRHPEVASRLIEVHSGLHEPRRSSVAADVRPILATTDRSPRPSQFSDRFAQIVHDVRDPVRRIEPVPTAQVRQQSRMDADWRLALVGLAFGGS